MADTINIQFTTPLNASCQVGDIAYYVTQAAGTTGGFTVDDGNGVVEIGQIRQIQDGAGSPRVTCVTTLAGWSGSSSKFILFSKDNKANLSSILGYYAEVKLVNDSTSAAELFSVAMDAFDSSK